MSGSAVLVSGLTKTFPGTKALDAVHLEIIPGEVHALVGQNGSGKSTFIKVLAGFHQPDPGWRAEASGSPFKLGDPAAARQSGLRFVHQDLGLVMAESTVDNLALGTGYRQGRFRIIKWGAQGKLAREMVGRLGHTFDVFEPVEKLSAVERTTVAIARAMQDSDTPMNLLVLDEPTATMPAKDVEVVKALVHRVRDAGVAVLYVSHHLDEVFAIADRVTVLRDGKLIATTLVSETSPRQIADQMTGGEVDIREREHREIGDPVLHLRNLSARVVTDLDLVVHAGEVVGVAGVDGSGRDELASAIFGGRPRSGEVVCVGRVLEADRPDSAVALGMAYVPADRALHGLILDMSVRENLTLGRLSDFWSKWLLRKGRELADVDHWIGRLGIKTASHEVPVSSLSGGNQQKVVLGRWLRLAPKVLLLDEPTQGVDVAAKAEVHKLIDEAADAGAAVLVCSSDESELVRLCSRVIVLERGRVRADLRESEISRATITRESLGVDFSIEVEEAQ
jgi:ribose transport system ATP-binding protein